MNIWKIFYNLIILTAIESYCNFQHELNGVLGKVNFIGISTGNSVPYSICEIPTSESPDTNANITLIQSPGLHLIHCDLSQHSSISSSKLVMAMTIQNRMSSRFSNSTICQVYNSVYYEIIKLHIEPLWISYIASQTSNASSYLTSNKTSGISALVELPSSEAATAINILGNFYRLISKLDITKQMIENAYTNAYTSNTITSLISLGSSSISTNEASNAYELCLNSRNDATVLSGGSKKDYSGVACGSCPFYNATLIQQESSSTFGKDYIVYLHNCILDERSFLIFSASKDVNIKNSINDLAISFIKITNPTSKIFLKPFFGSTLKQGIEYVYDQTNNVGSGGLSGYIDLGVLSLDSILAAGLIAKLTKSGTFDPPFSSSAVGLNIKIYGGRLQLRLSISYSSITGTVSQAWSSYISLVASRYLNNSNDTDFSSNTSIINELVKHFSPGSSNGAASFLTYGINEIYQDDLFAYLYWMEIFYGSFNVLQKLKTLNSRDNTYKQNAISSAAKKLISPSIISTNKTMCMRIE